MQVIKLRGRFSIMALFDFRCADDPLSRFLYARCSIFYIRYFRYQEGYGSPATEVL